MAAGCLAGSPPECSPPVKGWPQDVLPAGVNASRGAASHLQRWSSTPLEMQSARVYTSRGANGEDVHLRKCNFTLREVLFQTSKGSSLNPKSHIRFLLLHASPCFFLFLPASSCFGFLFFMFWVSCFFLSSCFPVWAFPFFLVFLFGVFLLFLLSCLGISCSSCFPVWAFLAFPVFLCGVFPSSCFPVWGFPVFPVFLFGVFLFFLFSCLGFFLLFLFFLFSCLGLSCYSCFPVWGFPVLPVFLFGAFPFFMLSSPASWPHSRPVALVHQGHGSWLLAQTQPTLARPSTLFGRRPPSSTQPRPRPRVAARGLELPWQHLGGGAAVPLRAPPAQSGAAEPLGALPAWSGAAVPLSAFPARAIAAEPKTAQP